MSAHILIARGDVRSEARQLLDRLHGAQRLGTLPDVDLQGDSTVVVIDPDNADVIPEFESIGFTRRRDEDSV